MGCFLPRGCHHDVLEARGIKSALIGRVDDPLFYEQFDCTECILFIYSGSPRLSICLERLERGVRDGFGRIGFVYFDEPEARDYLERDCIR